jgi:UDP-glucose:(heptosyl)LPS alpha-1,3-glucosyltransferase
VFHGGVERATAGLVDALVQHGYDVHLLSPRVQAPVPGVTRHVLPLPPLPSAARALALAALARVVVSRRGWDVVQSHERTLRQDIYRAGEGCHRAYLDSMDDAGRRRPLFHRVDLERFHPKNRGAERRAARAEAGVAADAWTLLFVGSGFERKGLGTVIEALALGSDRASRLLVVGRGATQAFREQAARVGVEGRIVWLGPRRDVERWYAAADVAVLPSRYEPFGNVHLEALASGVPVVASAVAGGAEAIVVVRPENLRIVATGGLIQANVVDVAFLGAQRTVRLEAPGLGELTSAARGAEAAPERETLVSLAWDDAEAWLIAAADQRSAG